MKKKRKKKNLSNLTLFRMTWPNLWRTAPWYVILSTLLGVVFSLIGAAQTLLNQNLFDRTAEFATDDAAWLPFLFALLWMIAIHVVQRGLGIGNTFLNMHFDITMSQTLRRDFFRKASEAEPRDFEDKEWLDQLNRAQQGVGSAQWFPMTCLGILAYYIPYLVFMSVYLLRIYPPLLLCLVAVFIPAFFSNYIKRKNHTELEDKIAPQRRAFGYFESALVGRDLYKENRILGAVPYLERRHAAALRKMQRPQFRGYIWDTGVTFGVNICSYVGYAAVLLVLFYALMNGKITVGVFAAVFQSIGSLYGLMKDLVSEQFSGLAEENSAITNYVSFLNAPSARGGNAEPPALCDITVSDVSFRYPQAQTDALRNVSFTLHAGETLAIVGENGAGKSTLVRLLSGIYLPQSGAVCYGGVKTSERTLQAQSGCASAVFQRYMKYQMTLAENITISDAEKPQPESLAPLLLENGVDPGSDSFPQGEQTMLSKEYDGVDLSGGQWQRIAIARGYYRDRWLMILDEPTAAIDPYEESRIYHRFAALSEGKSAVVVTHRLGSARLADRILVLRQGELVGSGTHESLLRECEEYRRLWQAQSKWYRKKEAAAPKSEEIAKL